MRDPAANADQAPAEPTAPGPLRPFDVVLAPQDVPLGELLGVPSAELPRLASIHTDELRPSVRLANCLKKTDLQRLDRVLAVPLGALWRIRNLGRKSIQELVDALAARLGVRPPVRTGEEYGVELSLGDDWRRADSELREAVPDWPADLREMLAAAGAATPEDVLDWPLSQVCDRLGPDELDALVAHLAPGSAPSESPAEPDPVAVLARRWAEVPLSAAAAQVLRGEFRTVGEVAAVVLGPSAAAYDLELFFRAHAAVGDLLGLPHDALAARRSLGARLPPGLLDGLLEDAERRCRPKEWRVLLARLGLDPAGRAATLRALAAELGLSPEGVRHVERRARGKVAGAAAPLAPLVRTVSALVRLTGGVAREGAIGQELERLFPGGTRTAEACRLALRLSYALDRVGRGAVWVHRDAVTPDRHQAMVSTARGLLWRSPATLTDEELVERVCAELLPKPAPDLVRACLQAEGGILGPDRAVRRQLNPLLVEVLRQLNRPAHFSEVARLLNEGGEWPRPISAHTVQARLTAHRELFVYDRPGTYGLAEWGLEDQRRYDRRKHGFIHDLAAEFLDGRGAPAPEAEIIGHVLAHKRCKAVSVQQRLRLDPRFRQVTRGVYGLAAWDGAE